MTPLPSPVSAARVQRAAGQHVRVWKHCLAQLTQRQALTMSAALCYRTIFAMVPLLLLALLGLKSMGMVDKGREYLNTLLGNTGLNAITAADHPDADAHPSSQPASGPAAGSRPASAPDAPNVADIIRKQIDAVDKKLSFGALGPVGAVLLVWSALSLLVTVETFLNRLFDAPQGRSWQRRILIYWTVVTLGPLLLSVVGFMGSRAVAAAAGIPWLAILARAAAWATPTAIGIFVLAGVYTWMPHVAVRFRAALAGAAATVVCWAVAMAGFSFYVNQVLAKGSLYGAMGALPLFLLWVYLSWAVFLLGAQLTATLNNPAVLDAAPPSNRPAGSWELLSAALAVARSYTTPAAPASADTVAALARLTPADAQSLLARLASAGTILPVASDSPQAQPAFVLAHGPSQLNLLDIMGLAPSDPPPAPPSDPAVAAALAAAQARTHQALGQLTLADILQEKTA